MKTLTPRFELNTKDLSETEILELKEKLSKYIIALTTRNDIRNDKK